MKTILFASVLALISIQSINAQTGKENINNRTKTETVKVYGECGMCKKSIEKAAASIDGVKSATWDEDRQSLSVKYDESKKDVVENVQKKVAAVGHDTEKFKATAEAYNNLPECCHYQRKQ